MPTFAQQLKQSSMNVRAITSIKVSSPTDHLPLTGSNKKNGPASDALAARLGFDFFVVTHSLILTAKSLEKTPSDFAVNTKCNIDAFLVALYSIF